MTVTETRKKELTLIYGAANCVKPDSWMTAVKDDLLGTGKIYSDDIEFLYKNPGWCITTPTPTTGVKIIESNGLIATIYEGTTQIGMTGDVIPLNAGQHTFTIKMDGYKDYATTRTIQTGITATITITLVKTSEPTEPIEEPPVETPSGIPVLVFTGNKTFPASITPGADNWFGMEYRNDGTAQWRGHLGIKLLQSGTEIFKWEGDSTKAQKIAVGETKMIWCKVTIPDTIPTGNLTVVILKYTL